MPFINGKSKTSAIEYGKAFAKTLNGGDVVLLDGQLGAGKTHFAKGVALGLNISDTITSPTFTLHNILEGGKFTLNHFDFYRLDSEDEALNLGLSEYFGDKKSVCLVEWWQNVKGLLPKRVKKVSIKVIDQNTREVTISDENFDN